MHIKYILRSNPETLPPVISQLIALDSLGYKIDLIAIENTESLKITLKNTHVQIISFKSKFNSNNLFSKIFLNLFFYLFVKKQLKESNNCIIWIGSADTAFYLRNIFKNKSNYYINLFELYDKFPKIIKKITPIVKNANRVIVPEYNRAVMFKCWFSLKNVPFVIPNKPYYSTAEMNDTTKAILNNLKKKNKKIIIYQGWISNDRDINAIAEAIDEMNKIDDKFLFVLMGKALDSSLEQLKKKYRCIYHIDFVSPPQHLFITSICYLGVATYDDSSLNNLYCAPNKIYEYSRFGIPMLCRDIPGLKYTVEHFEAGVCANTDNVNDVKKAISKIEKNYDFFSKNSIDFYNSVDVEKEIKKMLGDFYE